MDRLTRKRSLAGALLAAVATLAPATARAADGQGGFGSMMPGAAKSAAKATAKADSQFAVARLCERRGETDKAKELYQELTKKTPPKVKAAALHRLGVIAAKAGKLEVAEGYFQQAIAIAPDEPQLLGDMGYAVYLQGRHAEAVKLYRRALEKDSKNATLKNNLGLALGRQGKFNEAFDAFRQSGGEAQATNNLAYLHAQHGHADQAEAMYSRALTLNNKLRPAAEGLVQVARYKETELVTASDRAAPGAVKHAGKTAAKATRPPSRTVPAAHHVPLEDSDEAAADDGMAVAADDPQPARERRATTEKQSAPPLETTVDSDRPTPRTAPVRPRTMGRPRTSSPPAGQSTTRPTPTPVVKAEKSAPPERISLLVHDGDQAEVLTKPTAESSQPAPRSEATADTKKQQRSASDDSQPAPRANAVRSTTTKTDDEPKRSRSRWTGVTGSIGASHRTPPEKSAMSTPVETQARRSDAKSSAASGDAQAPVDATAAPAESGKQEKFAVRPRPAASVPDRQPLKKPSEPAKPKSLEELMASMQTAERESQPPRLPAAAYERQPAKAAPASATESSPRKPFPVTQRQQQEQRQPEQSPPRKKQFPQGRVPLLSKADKSKTAKSEVARADEEPQSEADGRSQPADRAAASQGAKAMNRQASSLPNNHSSHGDRQESETADPRQPRAPQTRTARQPSGAVDRARSWLDHVILGD